MEHERELSQLDIQEYFDQAFSCPVCLCPKLRMVYGACQHKVCVDCLYDEKCTRNTALDRCPVCLKDGVFPLMTPDIPKDNEMVMFLAGVRKCNAQGCQEQFWYWEMESHIKQHNTDTKPPEKIKEILKDYHRDREPMKTRTYLNKKDSAKKRRQIEIVKVELRSRTIYKKVSS